MIHSANNLVCGREAQCVNVPGSYECSCFAGSVPDPNSAGNACRRTSTCASNEQCVGNAVCGADGNCVCPEPNVGPNCESE